MPDDLALSGFRTYTRAQWAALGAARDGGPEPGPVGNDDPAVPMPADELDEVYRPLARLLAAKATGHPGPADRREGCSSPGPAVPFVVGVTGGVAAGKTTVARRIQALLRSDPALGAVEILSTDSFLFPNDRLAALGLGARKGFPESYDRPRLLAVLAAVRSGEPVVEVPVYSHRDYDILPGRTQVLTRPGVLVVEGLDVLQAGPGPSGAPAGGSRVSDFLDWSIYVDAAEADLARWHRQRLLDIHRAGSGGPAGFLGWFCSLSEDEAGAVAEEAWRGINSVNLRRHIAPTRVRASMILHKGPDHRVSHIRVRAS